jgi:hypothetical protein
MNTETLIKAIIPFFWHQDVKVLSYEGSLAVNQVPRFALKFETYDYRKTSDALFKPFTLHVGDIQYPLTITRATFISKRFEDKLIYTYEIMAAPALAWLEHSNHYRTFVNQSLSDIVKTLLSPTEKTMSVVWKLQKLSDAVIPYFVQVDEADLHCFQRLMAMQGMSYVMDVSAKISTLIIFDSLNTIANETIEIPYFANPESKRETTGVWKYHQTISIQPNKPKEKNTAMTDEVRLVPSTRVSFDHHNYFVIGFSETWEPVKKNQTLSYKKHLNLMPVSSTFAPMPIVQAPYYSTMFGLVTEDGIDERGYYRARLPFDSGFDTTIPMPFVQPFADKSSGMHFPLKPGIVVSIAFIEGDLRRPAILGAHPSSKHPSPVTDKNPQQTIIRTPAQQTFLMDDSEKSNITFSNVSNEVVFDSSDNTPGIRLFTQGHMNIGSIGDMTRTSDSHINTTEKNFSHTVGNNYNLFVENGSVKNQVNGNQTRQAKNNVSIDVEKDALIKSGNDITLMSQGNHTLQTQTDITMNLKGDATLYSAKDLLLLSEKDLRIQTNGGFFHLTQAGTFLLQGNNITFSAPKINVNANNVLHNTGQAKSAQASAMSVFATSEAIAHKTQAPFQRKKLNSVPETKPSSVEQATPEHTTWYTMSDDIDFTNAVPINSPHPNPPPQAGEGTKNDITPSPARSAGEGGGGGNIFIPRSEIIKLGHRLIPYPLDTLSFTDDDLTTVQTSHNPEIKAGDKMLLVETLPPALFIDLRQTVPDLKDTINYFKNNGNNAVIFIHGFNVSTGAYAEQILGFEDQTVWEQERNDATTVQQLFPKDSNSNRTVCITTEMLNQAFPDSINPQGNDITQEIKLNSNGTRLWVAQDDTCDDANSVLNGSAAHLWAVHMEHNLNVATGQFKPGQDYSKYTRILNIAWQGDLGVLNYMDSEETANAAGVLLADILNQLITAGIEVNILAHSMGNRVMMTALEELATKYQGKKINHAFSWDAALPDTALSNDPSKDLTSKGNGSFPHAMEALEKITVLYSNNDTMTLQWAYQAANVLYEDERQLRDDIVSVIQNPFQPTLDQKKALIKNRKVCSLPALGLNGPDKATINALGSKLIRANMTPWSTGHSYMKVPSQDVMVHGYQTYIINKLQGLKKFGLYSGAGFPVYKSEDNRNVAQKAIDILTGKNK